MSDKISITSSELGTSWMTYQKKKMMSRMLDYFPEKEKDEDAKNIMSSYYNNDTNFMNDFASLRYDIVGSGLITGFGQLLYR